MKLAYIQYFKTPLGPRSSRGFYFLQIDILQSSDGVSICVIAKNGQ